MLSQGSISGGPVRISAENLLMQGLCNCEEVRPTFNVHYELSKPGTSKDCTPSLNSDGYDLPSQASQASETSPAKGVILRSLLTDEPVVCVDGGNDSKQRELQIVTNVCSELEHVLGDASVPHPPLPVEQVLTIPDNALAKPLALEDLAALDAAVTPANAYEPISPPVLSLPEHSDDESTVPSADRAGSDVAAFEEQMDTDPNLPEDAVASPPQAESGNGENSNDDDALPAGSENELPQESADDMVWEELPTGALEALERVERAEERAQLRRFLSELFAEITASLREDVAVDLAIRQRMLERPINGSALRELEQRRVRLARSRSENWVALERYQDQLRELL